MQEAKAKVAALGRPVPWHLIGHLQTNKVKDALSIFDVIHSIDRLDLAREIDRRAASPVDVLLEVNVAEEPQKSGFAPGAVAAALDAIAGMAHLKVRGLMAIPPVVERAEDSRPAFRTLRDLAERHNLDELSMGMSGDFEVAVGGRRHDGPRRHRDLWTARVFGHGGRATEDPQTPSGDGMSVKGKRVGFLGGGNMGEALIKGLIAASVVPADLMIASDTRSDRLTDLTRRYGVRAPRATSSSCARRTSSCSR